MKIFKTITPAEMAQRQLDIHRRELVGATEAHEAAVMNVQYHERCIQKLQDMLHRTDLVLARVGG